MKKVNIGLTIVLIGLLGYLGYVLVRRATHYRAMAETREDHDPSKSPRVLMIGNSLIFHNSMNVMAQRIVRETDPEAWGNSAIIRLAAPGHKLIDHLSDVDDWWKDIGGATDGSEKWDYVVFQDQSAMMVQPEDDPIRNMSADAARQLVKRAKKIPATPMFLSTWAYDPNIAPEPDGYRAVAMQIDQGYRDLGRETSAQHVPAGLAFEAFRQKFGEEKLGVLYVSDRHLSIAGTYLAAATLAGMLTKKPTVGITWHPKRMTADNAKTLREIADDIVRKELAAAKGTEN